MIGAQATQSGGDMTSDPSPVDPALDALLPFPLPVRLRPESSNWLAAAK
jgi:hypothetical protein